MFYFMIPFQAVGLFPDCTAPVSQSKGTCGEIQVNHHPVAPVLTAHVNAGPIELYRGDDYSVVDFSYF